MGQFDEYYQSIDEIYECIVRDLFGVSSPEEILENVEPIYYYASGILYSMNEDEVQAENKYNFNDDINLIDRISDNDDTISQANKYYPSSMGISVCVPNHCDNISIVFSCGTYEILKDKPQNNNEQTNDDYSREESGTDDNEKADSKKKYQQYYKRSPQKFNLNIKVPNRVGITSSKIQVPVSDNTFINAEIDFIVRKINKDYSKLITVSVTNKEKDKIKTENSLFQCELLLKSAFPFLPVYENVFYNNDPESQIRQLLYSSVRNYAYGHGCSVEYQNHENGIYEIKSSFIPKEVVCQMVPSNLSQEDILVLDFWDKADRQDAYNKINDFIDEYEKWKNTKAFEINNESRFYKSFKEIIHRIEICIERLKNGNDYLLNDDVAWNSFKLMNKAMLLQRIHTKHQKPETIKWYPFQLAYILQIIPDIINEKSEYKNYVDLLWFPTGGGKTEAYLGVAAFTIFFRRLSNQFGENTDGVAVIMRYTLRLLTIQQFNRACALICACESLRKKEKIQGGEISIGLWIGGEITPNHISQAKEALEKLKKDKNEKIIKGNPIQILKCPWCGADIDVTGYEITAEGLAIRCNNNKNCEFNKKLPIYLVDDDIYMHAPTFLLSTIDKFARITWEENSQKLFGIGKNPPSLIIQDELHLISGALGSLAGLYEIVIDYLSSIGGKSPKIIASTATIKNADAQIKSLYARKMIQFPPNGISYNDSFFAHIADKDTRPARTYIGVCENGGSIVDLMIRIYSVLTFMKMRLIKEEKSDDVIDNYYTIIGYFNAIRDLGTSSSIIQDRMYANVKTLISHTFKDICQQLNIDNKTPIPKMYNEELTSRKSTKEIKETLEMLDKKYTEDGCFAYVLASNMLSVGIDIARLGVMAVYNQPKTNSEYIQATSRVGRKNPGVVIAMYNPMRSRDKSHYEQFGFYHKSFYQYVEATSLTPFSLNAMKKGLPSVFVAMTRMSIPKLTSNDSAIFFDKEDGQIDSIKSFILDRINTICPKAYNNAQKILNDIIEQWDKLTEIHSKLSYYGGKQNDYSLLHSAENQEYSDFPLILNSLRNVEVMSNIYFNS